MTPRALELLVLAAALGLAACGSTEDSLGRDRARGASTTGEYPNPIATVLAVDPTTIDARLAEVYQQLFHGDPLTEAIYFEPTADSAFVMDINNGDVRTDGIGYAMFISEQLDRQTEFDRIWTWSKTWLRFTEGPYAGLLSWRCLPDGTERASTPDPNGTTYIATSLLFADARWGSTGTHDYRADAEEMLTLMLHLVERNGSIIDDAHDLIDPDTNLVLYAPSGAERLQTASSAHLPAFFEIFGAAGTADSERWGAIADTSRAHLRRVAHPTTGLFPDRTDLAGQPLAGPLGTFAPDAYRAPLNLAVDSIWFATDPWQVEACDRLLAFLHAEGIDTYAAGYTLDGATRTLDYRSSALVAMAGAAAASATSEHREEFLQALWELEVTTGAFRYYDGMLQLLGLLTASGQLRITG